MINPWPKKAGNRPEGKNQGGMASDCGGRDIRKEIFKMQRGGGTVIICQT